MFTIKINPFLTVNPSKAIKAEASKLWFIEIAMQKSHNWHYLGEQENNR